MEDKKNNELRSRREFFKKAAKGALPILGAIVLANVPLVTKAAESSMGCNNSCYNTCQGCKGTCVSNCNLRCSGCGSSCFKGCAAGSSYY